MPPPLQDAPASAAGEGWGGGSDICRYTKSGLKYRPFTYTNPATLYVNCRHCCPGGGASPTLQVLRTELVGAVAATVAETRTATPLPRRAKPAAGEGWGGGSDICRYTKSGLKYRPFTYTNPAILYVNCRQCCLGGGAAPPYRFCGRSWSAQALQPPLRKPFTYTSSAQVYVNGLLNKQRGYCQ